MRIAVIPARGGSKRIPRKNIKLFGGKPMIAWSIEAAKKSECFERIIVSTDDVEIAEVALAFGAEVPFIRPPELSNDYAGTIPVIAHAVDWHNKHSGVPAIKACCVYATAPFLFAEDLQRGLNLLEETGADYAFGVTRYAFPIQRAIRISANRRVEMFQPQHFNTRSQDLEEAWHDAGQFYWGTTDAWKRQLAVFSSNSVPVDIPRIRVQDIDTEQDWEYAEVLRKVMNSNVM